MGSVIFMSFAYLKRPNTFDVLPACLDDAGDFPSQGELTEADTAHFELPEIPTRAAATAAAGVGLNRETRFLERLCDERGLGHEEVLLKS
jgi:hypothetical protein